MVDEAKVLIAASGMKILPISDLEVTPAPFIGRLSFYITSTVTGTVSRDGFGF
jgi:hypothetical protein